MENLLEVETHVCKLYAILQSRIGLCDLNKDCTGNIYLV